jgi:uncharacterized protein
VVGVRPSEILRTSIDRLAAGDLPGYVELFHDDVVVEFPFAQGDSPRRLEGRESLAAYVAERAERLRIDEITEWVDHGEVVEVSVRGTVLGNGPADGAPYVASHVVVLEVVDYRIRRYRDYRDPLS